MNSMVDDMRMLIDRKLFEDEASLDLSAYRSLLVLHPELRLELALHRYERKMVSLGRAAEIAGLSVEQLKEVMSARGVQRRIAKRTSDEIKKRIRIACGDGMRGVLLDADILSLFAKVDAMPLKNRLIAYY